MKEAEPGRAAESGKTARRELAGPEETAQLEQVGPCLLYTSWSKTKGLVIFVIALVAVLKSFGYNFLVLLSGMSSVSDELIEAAKLEKTGHTKIFTGIVMPLTSSTAIYVLIISIVQGMQYVFTPIKVLTQGGPNNASSNIIYGVDVYKRQNWNSL